MSNSAEDDALTYFNRLTDEPEENAPEVAGMLGGFFNRWFKNTDSPEMHERAQPNLPLDDELQVSLESSDQPEYSTPQERPPAADSPGAISRASLNGQDIDGPRKKSNRLTALFKKERPGLIDYNRSSIRQYWMPDATGKECYQCEEKFTAFRRRHHCRLCGQIFCAKCCNDHIPGAPLGYIGDLRLCIYCSRMVQQYIPEEDGRTPSEEMTSPPTLPLNTIAERPSISESGQMSSHPGISTVSAGNVPLQIFLHTDGSLMWSRNESTSAPRKNSLSLPPPSYKPPAMLCVQELYMQHSSEIHSAGGSGVMLTAEEEESGPDWVRNMDLTGHGQYDTLKTIDRTSDVQRVHFDVEPLTIEQEENVDTKEVQRKESLSARQSLSPNDSSKERYMNEDDVEKMFDRRAEMLLDFLLKRENINSSRWREALMKTAQEVAQIVDVDVYRRKDNMNVLNYVHIKKLLTADDNPGAETIRGVVCTNAVAHSDMSGELKNASVMIVAGSIEYERISGRLSGIEPIICQEREFLTKQVERILSKRPTLLLVETNASRIAADLLREAGVRLVIGIKSVVLSRIARSTGADILPSGDAQLIQQNIGFCPSFSQRIEQLKDGRMKILLVFDQCPAERGCSILLRSNSSRELKAIKRVLQFMISALYSAKLEKSYLSLFNCKLSYQISSCDACEARRENIELDPEDDSAFLSALDSSILSASPFLEYEPPFLETRKGKACSLMPYFKQPLYKYGTEEEYESASKEEEDTELQRDSTLKPKLYANEPRHPFATKSKAIQVTQAPTAGFRSLSGRFFVNRLRSKSTNVESVAAPASEFSPTHREDVLDPYVHQRVAILFGSFSPKSPNSPFFCVRPWVISMQFYAANDMTLGEFLTKFCFNKEYECPSTNCDVPMLDHSRKMVFGRVCVEVTIQQVLNGSNGETDPNAAQQGILTYHYCESCKTSSPFKPLDAHTWHLSFAKFLEYIANSSFSTACITTSTQQTCQHCFFHQHSHFFSYNNLATRFKVTTIRPFHVHFSPVICAIQPGQVSAKSLVDMVTRIGGLADDICATASERLVVFTQHEQCTHYAGTFHTVLRGVVDKAKMRIAEIINNAHDVTSLELSTVPSNDPLAIKANDVFMQIRETIYQLITTWNEQGQVLSASVRAMKKTAEEGGGSGSAEMTDIALERIDDPFPSYLHLSLKLQPRVSVVVRDIQDGKGEYKPDIGSIIAYALSSVDYEEGRRKAREAMGGEDVPLNLNSSSMQDETSLQTEHIEIEFQDPLASYYVKAYYAERFRLLRKLLFPAGEEAFIRSLATSSFWTPQGGKSGAFFYRTQDHRFVIKQMSRFEVQSFVKFAPRYFEYIKTAVTENKLTTLCKVYGVFRVGYKSKATGAQVKTDILVMEYLFYKHNVSQVWDLKGSLRNRMASGKSSSDLVLMDENLMKDLWNNQLYVYPHSKAALSQAISNDSHFLSAQHVMDYSLLVGVDETNGELVLGIVDYMRTYTLDKKLESWVKIVAIPGAHLPTVISPEMYCTRFSEAIDTYFPVVPDQWTGLGSSLSY